MNDPDQGLQEGAHMKDLVLARNPQMYRRRTKDLDHLQRRNMLMDMKSFRYIVKLFKDFLICLRVLSL